MSRSNFFRKLVGFHWFDRNYGDDGLVFESSLPGSPRKAHRDMVRGYRSYVDAAQSDPSHISVKPIYRWVRRRKAVR